MVRGGFPADRRGGQPASQLDLPQALGVVAVKLPVARPELRG